MSPTGTVSAFEEAYVQRAAGVLAGRSVDAVSPDLDPVAGGGSSLLAGWWTRPAAGPGVIRLPNPWDDHEALALYEERCDALLEWAIEGIAPVLRDANGLSRSRRGWELLLGPLLLITLTEVADRRLFVRAAAQVAPGAPLLAAGAPLRPSATIAEAVDVQLEEDWNLALIERLAELEELPTVRRDSPPRKPAPSATSANLALRAVRAAAILSRPLPLRFARLATERRGPRTIALLGQLRFDARSLTALARTVPGARIAAGPPFAATAAGPDSPARGELARIDASDGLELAVRDLLPDLIPRSALEHHAELVDHVRRTLGEPCHAVHGNWAFTDAENEFLARCHDSGRRIAFAQHGGSIYQLKLAPHDRLERRAGDMQLAWGHTSGPERAAPSPYVARLHGSHRGGRRIVVVEGLTPPYTWTYRFTTTPIADQCTEEEARLVRFVEALGPARDLLMLKRFPRAGYEGARHPVLDALPQALGALPRGAAAWMRRASLAVIPYPDTPFIEAMAIGVPVVGLWSSRWWEMREDAAEPFEELARAGVVYEDPAAAAAQVDRVAVDPAAWWSSDRVQTARERFVQRFAARDGWLAAWRSALAELAS